MAKPTEVKISEVKISVRCGTANLGETFEAEVSATYKIDRTSPDMPSLVLDKFHEVRFALLQALNSKPPSKRNSAQVQEAQATEASAEVPREGAGITLIDGSSGADGSSVPAPPSTNPKMGTPPGAEEEIPESETAEEARATPEQVNEEIPAPVQPGVLERVALEAERSEWAEPIEAEAAPAIYDLPVSEEMKITPAQKRTIVSLCNAAGIGDSQLRAMLEGGFNRKTLEDLGRREAASLILQLSQRQRGRILRDKTDSTEVPGIQRLQKETIHPNGTAQTAAP